MTTFAVIAGVIGAGAFAILVGLLAYAPRSNRVGRYLIAACAVTSTWFAGAALYYSTGNRFSFSLDWLQYLELTRDALWLLFLARLLETVGDSGYRRRVYLSTGVLLSLIGLSAVAIAAPDFVRPLLDVDPAQLRKLLLTMILLVVLGGLVMTEQLFRNSSRDSRWALKHLCFGLGLIFAYDFYLYADAVLFNRLDAMIWASRGMVNAVAVPMLALSASRNREWKLNIFVSRRVVFHGVTLMAAGAYLMTMAAAGYYIQIVGGEWGQALKVAFFSAAILVLLSFFFSLQLRSRIRIFLARHFYRNKYEYGEEWLKFTQALSRTELDPRSLNQTILNTIADMVDSPGGLIFQRTPSGNFSVATNLSVYESCNEEIRATDEFAHRLQESAKVWDLTDEAEAGSETMAVMPNWLSALPRVGLIVPIVHGDDMLALLVLARPRSNQVLDWEDLNLLGTVGRQAAGYLALMRATDALSEARQFETFNRLSAFLVHDLKNVVAQLTLIGRNAERHGTNPEFVRDAFNTINDAVDKMNRMLASLRQMHTTVDVDEVVDLRRLACEAVAANDGQLPLPIVTDASAQVFVYADKAGLLSVVEHLLQNAIEATDPTGTVEVTVQEQGNQAHLAIADTGCGMDRDFINNRLFKAFDTTKGKAGMGIGAYESRHMISSMHGELRVESEPGQGSRFTIVLPRAERTATDLVAADGSQ